MSKTLTILLLSGCQENEDACFAIKLSRAALKAGHKVNLFLTCNATLMANQDARHEKGETMLSDTLRAHMERGRLGSELSDLAAQGADISTCHTTEFGRGTEGYEYRDGVKWGDMAGAYTKYLMQSDVHLCLAR